MLKICCPSYKRPKIFKEKTLAFLISHKVFDWATLDVILETKEMVEEYKEVLRFMYLLPKINFIVSNTKGICEKRNFVRSYYRDNTNLNAIVCIDDDIDNLYLLDKSLKSLHELIVEGHLLCEKHNLNLWGVSPFHNPFFMKNSPRVSTNLKYICGAFFGLLINRDKYLIHSDVDHGEDFQFSMEHFLRDGGVLRLNHIAIKTKYFEEKGGICESLGGLDNRKKQMKENCEYLCDRYGSMCRLHIKNYGYDIRLNSRFNQKSLPVGPC
tara:strand:+ start:1294 stop:2097 length:804 start_codon:yes stop_codon:yes gene_type:complete